MAEVIDRLSDKERHLDALSRRVRHVAPEWLRQVRETGALRFEALPFPTHKDEDWRFTDVKPIIRGKFEALTDATPEPLERAIIEPYLFTEPSWTELVFVDGFCAPGASRIGETRNLTVYNLADAVLTDGALARQY